MGNKICLLGNLKGKKGKAFVMATHTFYKTKEGGWTDKEELHKCRISDKCKFEEDKMTDERLILVDGCIDKKLIIADEIRYLR